MYALIALAGGYAVTFAVMLSIIRAKNGIIDVMENEMKRLVDAENRLNAEVGRLRKSAGIVSENRRWADEKIDCIHRGDSVGNALDVLRNADGRGNG